MKINEQFVGNHQHLDGGSFQLYYKGPLAIDAGAYQGSSGKMGSSNLGFGLPDFIMFIRELQNLLQKIYKITQNQK